LTSLQDLDKTASLKKEMVIDKIRDIILTHKLLPGQKIVQDDIANELGVSKIPVREALRMLEAEGWVESNHGKGFVVAVQTIEDVYEMYVIRAALEGVAAREVTKLVQAEKKVGKRLAQAEKFLEQMEEEISIQEWLQLNTEFHSSIYRESHLIRVIELINRYTLATSRWVYSYAGEMTNRKRANLQHREIFDAVINGRAGDAERLTLQHLEETRDKAIEWLKMTGVIQPR